MTRPRAAHRAGTRRRHPVAVASLLTVWALGAGCADRDAEPPTPDAVGQLARTGDAMCWLPGNGDPLRCWLTIDPEALSSDTDDVDWSDTTSRVDDVPRITSGQVFVPPAFLSVIAHVDRNGRARFYSTGARGTDEEGGWLTAMDASTADVEVRELEMAAGNAGFLVDARGRCHLFDLTANDISECYSGSPDLRSLFDTYTGRWGLTTDGLPYYVDIYPEEHRYLPTDGPRFKEAYRNGGCAITVDDDVVCYPYVPYGDPSLDLPDEHYVPPDVEGPHGMHEEGTFGCLLDADGRIHCWGQGYAVVKEAWGNPPQGTGFQRVYAFRNGVICGVKDGGATCTGPGVTPELLAGLPPIGGSGR